jgi:transcriptional repressor NrdR
MICPYCHSKNIMVVDSRDVDEKTVRRRRACSNCSKRFTTYEKIEMSNIMVIKKEDKREQFDKNKIINGMIKACEKRPVSSERINAMADRIESKIRKNGINEIKSSKIGDMVMLELLKADPVAYIRFASVYRQFDSPAEFTKVIEIFKSKDKK